MMAHDESLKMRLNLYISARKLTDLDIMTKSDPCAAVFEKKQNGWVRIGKTEKIKNNLNPDFETALEVDYYFERLQPLRISIIDDDHDGDFEEIGTVETNMGSLMGAKAQTFSAELTKNGSGGRGTVIVRAEAVQSSNVHATFLVKWQNLNNLTKGFIGIGRKRKKVRFEIGREIPGTDKFAEIFASKKMKQESPDFSLPQMTFSLQALCNNNKYQKIRFSAWNKKQKLINEVTTTIEELESGKGVFDAQEGSSCVIDNFQCFVRPSLPDYLRSGWQISIVGAIDYTASNGNPSNPSSLHFMSPNNQYEKALNSVGYVLEPYDNDRSFPVFGFGGIPRHIGQNATNHCFAINGNPANPEIVGIEQIVNTYRQTLPQIGLGGPTLFGPLLEQFKAYVSQFQSSTVYNVLLLLTDGAIHDMPATKSLLVDLSGMACSVIIIGVGNADFSSMEELDGDGGPLRDNRGRSISRDIVQFVEFNQAMARGNLAEQVLKEIPNQFCQHMERIGFVPQAVAHDMAQFQV